MLRRLCWCAFFIGATAGVAQSSHDPDPAAQISATVVPVGSLSAHPIVALTFDDLPKVGALPEGMTWTGIAEKLTSELKANGLSGTYGFVNGSRLESDSDAQKALRTWVDAGMNVGSHTWSHPPLPNVTVSYFEHDIDLNEPALKEFSNRRNWHWFRYPFLWEGETLEKRRAVRAHLLERDYRVAQVTLDFEDYAWNDAYVRCKAKQDSDAITWLKQSYLDTAKQYVRLGREEQLIAFGHEVPNVMLLHANAFTTLMLPDLIAQLRSEGFSFASLPDVESDPVYALDSDAALRFGGTLPDQFMDSRHLKYPPVAPKPFQRLKTICD